MSRTVRLRSIYASSMDPPPPEEARGRTGAFLGVGGVVATTGDVDVERPGCGDGGKASTSTSANDAASTSTSASSSSSEPLRLPPSTHTLLFAQPLCSTPFLFSTGILLLSYASLFLVAYNDLILGGGNDPINPFGIPVNVTTAVRGAQYLAILVALLMEEGETKGRAGGAVQYLAMLVALLLEEEIPTGLYLLRMFPRVSFERRFPDMNYHAFVASSILRIFMGYLFLLNAFGVLIKANAVIEIFYDVIALQFVQQLDDIAFSLARMDVLGKKMLRACTAKCFQTEFEKERLGRSKKLGFFLKAVYGLNLAALLAGMAVVSTRQISGHYQCESITVDFGQSVWDEAVVNMPQEQYDRWVSLYPYFADAVSPDRDEIWTLVFSYFNGFYEKDGTHAGRPIYRERRKHDRTPYGEGMPHEYVVPATIKFCEEISAWVFTHDYIQRSKKKDGEVRSGCNWLLRSEETTEYDLMSVSRKWYIWMGVIGETEISYVCNRCSDETSCNMNGECEDGKCVCNEDDDAQFLGTHCERKLKKSCETIVSDNRNATFSVRYLDSYDGKYSTLFQLYDRPTYRYVGGFEIDGFSHEEDVLYLVFTGNRWFIKWFSTADYNITAEALLISIDEYHAFWGRDYDPMFTKFVSAPTKKDTPVGVDFYWIEERGDHFGPWGSLIPIQKNNQIGRGFFRCGGNFSLPVY